MQNGLRILHVFRFRKAFNIDEFKSQSMTNYNAIYFDELKLKKKN